MRIPRLAAAAAALLVLLLVVAGAAAVAGDVGPEEIAAKARANEEEAVLAAELGKLRAKVSALGACLHCSIPFGPWLVHAATAFVWWGFGGDFI
jgi:hypothetical protein